MAAPFLKQLLLMPSICSLLAMAGHVMGVRTIPLVTKEIAAPAPSPIATEGTCKALVETYGYDCEEHMVRVCFSRTLLICFSS